MQSMCIRKLATILKDMDIAAVNFLEYVTKTDTHTKKVPSLLGRTYHLLILACFIQSRLASNRSIYNMTNNTSPAS